MANIAIFDRGLPLSLTGATAATRYVGATASGAPATGTFLVGDFAIAQNGAVWLCTAAGSPGTWAQLGVSGTTNVVSTAATALTVAAAGSNYGLQVDESTASAVTGIKIKAGAAAGGVAVSVISTGTDENVTFDAKGAGTVSINTIATGKVIVGADLNFPKEVARVIQIIDTTSSNTAGAQIQIKGAAGNGSGTGGAARFDAGAGGATGAGGAVIMTGGLGGATSGAGGAITIQSGLASVNTASASGSISVRSAAGTTSAGAVNGGASGVVEFKSLAGGTSGTANGGASGTVSLLGGDGGAVVTSTGNGGAAGTIIITGGNGGGGNAVTGGAGAAVTITAGNGGNGSTASGLPGSVVITAGSAGTGGNVAGGNVDLVAGAAVGSGVIGNVRVEPNTATPAAGSTRARLLLGSTAGFGLYFGSGAPTVSAAKGSLYLRSDGTTTNDRAYINTNGSTTWTALTTAA